MKMFARHRFRFGNEYFLVLLPFFFVFHGYVEYPVSIRPLDAFILFLKYALGAISLLLIFFFLTKNFRKASVAAFVVCFVNFFMGSFREFIKEQFGQLFIIKYSIFLLLLLMFCLVFFVIIKNTTSSLDRLTRYLNIVLFVLCLLDVFTLVSQKPWENQNLANDLSFCKSCTKPDIFLIVADEYAGERQLTEELSFDNSQFLNELETRGFHVLKNTLSNYNQSMYSMASMLSMDYLHSIEKKASSKRDINECFRLTNKNAFVDYLISNRYEVTNFSIFPFASQYSPVEQTFIYTGINLITHQTLLSRLERDIGFNLVTKYKFGPAIEKMNREYFSKKNNNEILIKKLVEEIKDKDSPANQPRLIYTHLLMPHYPFYFNSEGKSFPIAYELPDITTYKLRYVEYLKYCNKRFLQIIDLILKNATKPPVIIFMSDHGLRMNNDPKSIKYHFMNINTVYYPSKDYGRFYPGMSNVNQLRVVLNDVFHQNLPLLKDSTIFIE